MKPKPWWKSKKVWGTVLALALRIWGNRLGVDVDAAVQGAYILLGGVAVEGVIDAASAFSVAWKKGQ